MEDSYIVYVKTELNSNIISVNSSAFITDITGWVQIDEGEGDKFHHAQGNYLDNGLMDENGCYNYKLVNRIATERTVEEKQIELASRPPQPPTIDEKQSALEGRIDLAEDAINFLLML